MGKSWKESKNRGLDKFDFKFRKHKKKKRKKPSKSQEFEESTF